jgi:hypothetical protein
VGVPLGGGDSGVAEHLLYGSDVHALVNEESRCGVPGIVDPDISDAGLLQDGLPVLPVLDSFDRGAVLGGEHQVVVLPALPRLLALGVLDRIVRLELSEEFGRALQGEPALALALAEDQAAARPLGALVRVARAVLEAGPTWSGRCPASSPRPGRYLRRPEASWS